MSQFFLCNVEKKEMDQVFIGPIFDNRSQLPEPMKRGRDESWSWANGRLEDTQTRFINIVVADYGRYALSECKAYVDVSDPLTHRRRFNEVVTKIWENVAKEHAATQTYASDFYLFFAAQKKENMWTDVAFKMGSWHRNHKYSDEILPVVVQPRRGAH